MNSVQVQILPGQLCPQLSTDEGAAPSTSKESRKRKSSKAVRSKKQLQRRMYMNNNGVKQVLDQFLGRNIIVVDDEPISNVNAFAFIDWYYENYREASTIETPLIMKLRDVYFSFNFTDKEVQVIRNIVRDDQMFHYLEYDDPICSGSDESIYKEEHKIDEEIATTDVMEIDELDTEDEPVYRPISPEYMEFIDRVTEQQNEGQLVETDCDDTDTEASPKDHKDDSEIESSPVHLSKKIVSEVILPMRKIAKVTYPTPWRTHLRDSDFKAIRGRVKEIFKSHDKNLKLYVNGHPIYLKVNNIMVIGKSERMKEFVTDAQDDWNKSDWYSNVMCIRPNSCPILVETMG